ncbi:MAG: flavin reductase family protein [Deltaproteobacteria bacterium]|nr:flavin reductase family protein [Deltaproteobacteria bacterium]
MSEPPSIAADQFKALMGSFAAGVTVVTTRDLHGNPWGLTATAFSSLSLDPPLCLVCIDRRTASHRPLVDSGRFAVSMLTDQQQDLSNHFASKLSDKFAGVPWIPGTVTAIPVLSEALAWMECSVAAIHDGGDHDIFVGRILSAHLRDGKPLIYWRGAYADLTSRPKAW